jgi:hypothetical protein
MGAYNYEIDWKIKLDVLFIELNFFIYLSF